MEEGGQRVEMRESRSTEREEKQESKEEGREDESTPLFFYFYLALRSECYLFSLSLRQAGNAFAKM